MKFCVQERKVFSTHPLVGKRLFTTVLFTVMHIPFVILLSVPSLLYIFAENMPAEDNLFFDVFGSTILVALIKVLVNKYGIPVSAVWLSKIKYGMTSHSTSSTAIVHVYVSQVRSMLTLLLLSSSLMPLILVVLIDEACLRYYLHTNFFNFFHKTQQLDELLQTWDVAVTGIAAYR